MPTAYDYMFSPTDLGCGVTANIGLTIVNSGATQTGGTQTVVITVPTGSDDISLTATPATISVTGDAATQKAGWAGVLLNGLSGYVIKLQGPPLAAQQVLNFAIDMVGVNSQPGTVVLPITEQFGSPPSSGVKTLIKQFLSLKISSFEPLSPYSSVPGQATLTWTVQGGSYVVLLPLNVQRPTQGTGPFSDQYAVQISNGPSTPFTLQLWTDNNQYVSANLIVYAGPVTASLNSSTQGAIDITTPVSLAWSSAYAVPPLMLYPAPSGSMRLNASGTTSFTPGSLLTDNATSLTFALQANGWNGPATAITVVYFSPVEILFLRYSDSTKIGAIWGAKNNIPTQTSLVLSRGVYTLTANGPGGPVTQQLGPVPALQVQLLIATPGQPNIGDTVTLDYQTANATGVIINGEAVPWDATTQTGSTTLQYNGPQILTMVATGSGGATLSSQLTLPC